MGDDSEETCSRTPWGMAKSRRFVEVVVREA